MGRRHRMVVGLVAAAAAATLVAPASAQAGGEGGGQPPFTGCTGFAYDVRLELKGVVSGFFGPAVATDPNVFPDSETLSNLALTVPGDPNPFATAETDEAENSGNPMLGCMTRITLEDFFANLNNLGPAPDIPVTVSAKLIESKATARRNPIGPPSHSSSSTILSGVVTVGPRVFVIPVTPRANTVLVDFRSRTLIVRVILRNTSHIRCPDGTVVGDMVDAIRVRAILRDSTGVVQDAKLSVAHAEADVEPCP